MDTTRELLFRNATEIVRRGGVSSLNFRDLGQLAGVKSSTVHYYFPTKSALLKEIASEYRKNFVLALDAGIQSSRSFKQDLIVLVELFEGAQKDGLSCLCGVMASEVALLEPSVRTTVNQFFATLQEWVQRQARARNADQPGGFSSKAFADFLVSLLEGALLLSRLASHKSSLKVAKEWIQKEI